jgi:hypothetical protein
MVCKGTDKYNAWNGRGMTKLDSENILHRGGLNRKERKVERKETQRTIYLKFVKK